MRVYLSDLLAQAVVARLGVRAVGSRRSVGDHLVVPLPRRQGCRLLSNHLPMPVTESKNRGESASGPLFFLLPLF